MRRGAGLLLAGALFLLLAGLAVPDPPVRRVNDWGGMISPAAEAELEQLLAQHERETSNQMVIATFPSLEGDSLERFSIKLAERWKVGQAGKDNGVILLAFRDDRKLRIEVGYGLESALPDGLAGMIIRNELAPRFKDGDYDGGFKAGTAAILGSIKGTYPPPRDATSRPPVATRRSQDGEVASLLALSLMGTVLVVGLLIKLLEWFFPTKNYSCRGSRRSGRRSAPGNHSAFSWGSRESSGSSGWSSGWSSGSSSRSSDSDFSAGGGRFGGGGASGGW